MGTFRLSCVLALVSIGSLCCLQADSKSPEAPIGWASVENGTTGGKGATVVVVKNAEAFLKQVQGNQPAILHVEGTIRLLEPARVGSNKTIQGIGANAAIVGGGLHLHKVSNVIIRNLSISDANDAINIEETHHVWVDHCDLSKCKDGLLDIKRGSDLITASWNRFHDHGKTSLVGHSDKPEIKQMDTGHLRVTYHHNFFDGSQTRHPRVRYAETVHVFNNYFLNNSHGVHSAMDAGVLVEGNYFESVMNPTDTVFGDSPDPGRLVERNNVYDKCVNKPQTRGTVKEIGDSYKYTLDPSADISMIVKKGAGVGKIDP